MKNIMLNRHKITVAKSIILSALRALFIIGIAFYILYPIFTKLMLALMDQKDIYDATVSMIPKNITFDNFKLVADVMKYGSTFLNSSFLSIMVMTLQLACGLLVGYGFGRFVFPFKNVFFALGILMLVVPPQVLIMPLYLTYRYFDVFGIIKLITGHPLNLLNTYVPFALSSFFGTGIKGMLFIFMFRQYFRGMPKEIEEAALVDGAGAFKTFYSIMLPSATPVIACVTLLSFVWQWNDILYTGWFFSDTGLLSTALKALTTNVQQYMIQVLGKSGEMPPSYAALLNGTGTLLLMAPLLALYLFVQKYFIKSVERSGIVG